MSKLLEKIKFYQQIKRNRKGIIQSIDCMDYARANHFIRQESHDLLTLAREPNNRMDPKDIKNDLFLKPFDISNSKTSKAFTGYTESILGADDPIYCFRSYMHHELNNPPFGSHARHMFNAATLYNLIVDYINPRLSEDVFIYKKTHSNKKDNIDDVRRFLKLNNVKIHSPLTVSLAPLISDEYARLVKSYKSVQMHKGVVDANKRSMTFYKKTYSKYSKYMKCPDSLSLIKTDYQISKDEYTDSLEQYNDIRKHFHEKMRVAQVWHDAPVYVVFMDSSCYYQARPADVDDIKKHSESVFSAKQIYADYTNAINEIDHMPKDPNISVQRLAYIIEPLLSDHPAAELHVLSGDYVRHILHSDIRYYRRHDDNGITPQKEIIKNDKAALAKIGNAKYIKSTERGTHQNMSQLLTPYTRSFFAEVVGRIKKELISAMFSKASENPNFDPLITVPEAKIAVDIRYDEAYLAKQRQYKERAAGMVKWLFENYPDAKIRYRQLIPANHNIYKKNIKNIKKAVKA